MSRSYKKTPVCTDHTYGRQWFKRKANKRVRKSADVPNGKKYKKYSCTWDIHDYRMRWTKEEAERTYHKDMSDISNPYMVEYTKKYKDKEDYLNDNWRKWFYRK